MKNKGYTLIELLAVIVILSIVTIIAVPIVLNIVNDSKEESNKRSVEMYAKAVENAVVAYQLKEGKEITGSFELDPENQKILKQGNTTLVVDYDGEVVCNTIEIYEDGSFYLDKCKVNKNEKEYTYGSQKASQYLINKANPASVTTYEAGTAASHQMYTFDHEATKQTDALTDYRYIGNDPYNYVTFNGDELWRIVGVFTVEDKKGKNEQRVKIIRNDSIGDYVWDSNNSNEWSTSILNTYLNGEYYKSLTTEAKNMIAETKFYLGGNSIDENHSAASYYTFERGEEVYDETRSKNWIGNIGLIYPSDYVYTYALGVDDICYNNGFNCWSKYSGKPMNGWLHSKTIYKWLITPGSNKYNSVFNINCWGGIFNHFNYAGGYGLSVGARYNVLPTLYLSYFVKIVDGDGSQENPYKLKI